MHPASSAGERVAFFGGSFDPPHLGHIAIARAARQALALDRVLFAPVGLQPLKPSGSTASFEDRVAMTRLAIAGDPGFEVSLADAPKKDAPNDSPNVAPDLTPNFTIDTLAALCQSLPKDAQLFLLLGADSFRTLHHWHRAAEIPFLASLIVATRPTLATQDQPQAEEPQDEEQDLFCCLPPGIAHTPIPGHPNQFRLTNVSGEEALLTILPNLHYDVSATQLRRQLRGRRQGEPQLLDPRVLAYIRKHHLYS